MSTVLKDPPDVVEALTELITQASEILRQSRELSKEDEPAKISSSKWLNSSEAAKYLGISVKSVYRIVELKQIVPARATRRQYRFTQEMLDQYLCR
jgi:excisionase family DNA binding protein